MVEIVGLISGGKDSIYNLIECVRNGHKIVALANLKPPKTNSSEELDSFMYQTVGNNLIEIIAKECLELPLYQIEINGTAISRETDTYNEELEVNSKDEVEDLHTLLKLVKESHPNIKGVSCGAILSTYQRIRVENCCSRLNLTSYSYLWNRNQDELLREMIDCKIEAIIIKVASMGLVAEKHLLKSITQLYPTLYSLNQKFGVHICGEGGEYESIVIDCPLYKKRINIDQYQTIIHSDDAFSQVAYASISKYSTTEKSTQQIIQDSIYLNSNYLNRNLNNLKNFNENLLIPTLISNSTNDQTNSTNSTNFNFLESNLNIEYSLNLIKNKNFFNLSSTTTKINDNDIDNDKDDYNIGELLDKALLNISNILKENSLSIDQLLYVNLYISDMKDFSIVNQYYYKYFKNNPASRACIEIPLSKNDKTKFLIDCIGAIEKKSNLHVQSISNWAPACIGPYSQANLYKGFTFLAGQISMIPNNLDLIKYSKDLTFIINTNNNNNNDINNQLEIEIQQILLNTYNLLDCLNISFSNVIQSTIFISNEIDSTMFENIINYLKQFFIDNNNDSGSDGSISLIQIFKIPKLPKNSNIEILFTLFKEPEIIQNDLTYDNIDQYEENKNNNKNNNNTNPMKLEINDNRGITLKISNSNSFIHSQFNNLKSDIKFEDYINQLFLEIQSILNQTRKSIIYIKFYYLISFDINKLIELLSSSSSSSSSSLKSIDQEIGQQYLKLSSFIPILDSIDHNQLSCEIFIN
ncbi:endoribonuclease L-PSP domain-containing protein [Dictyostelium discoideum AX4]|uniref:Diphthine--ammonia ligase n=1 Tax=Dictyostelium discoideum TaxID=44689 RepID=Q54Y82_DICDI|nr:endoribonuclease L-PSP domain-containing protein [Dictyostelium discoideum AX4]EAL68359.1 endoribonuclease L-PSP domain-containing protein [Dictyostelium discoideum AX4]|eukprot:XP_642320.1 endoribonuclease L-PSP domain-containing protein [Dictyostelium discoideum AX4]